MPQMSKVELYAAIRRDRRAGMTMRELERKRNVARRAVRKALESAWPEPRKPLPSALDPRFVRRSSLPIRAVEHELNRTA